MQGQGTVHWIDFAVILAFIALAVRNGLKARKVASENIEEYFLAGRSLPGWKAGFSMAATQFAADTPLLVAGLIAVSGIFALWRLWIYGVAFLVLGFVLAGSWQRAGVLTDAELTEVRYGKKPAAVLRGVKAVYFGTVFNCTVLAMVLLASTRIAEPFLVWDQWLPAFVFNPLLHTVEWLQLDMSQARAGDPTLYVKSTNNLISILAIVLVTLSYSATGGLRSVVQTDAMQLVLALGSTALFAYYVVSDPRVGGLGGMREQLFERFGEGGGPGGISAAEMLAFTPSGAKDLSLALLVVFATQWFFQINADGTGYLAQRTMACRTPRDAKMAALTLTTVQVLVRSLLWLPIGLGLLLIIPTDPVDEALAGAADPRRAEAAARAGIGDRVDGESTEPRPVQADAAPDPDAEDPRLAQIRSDREYAYVVGFKELLPIGLLGIMLTGMLAALASTVDTHLNWGASYWTNDLYKRFLCRRLFGRDPDPRELVWVARGATIAILGLSLAIMAQLPSIQDAWQASLLLGAGIGPLLVLRWLWWRITSWAELAATVASLVLVGPLFSLLDDDLTRMLVMATLASGVGIATAIVLGPEEEAVLRAFYRRTRPPGFWGPIARVEGVDPAEDRWRLARGAAAVVLSALSIFALLVGIGTWLCGSPAPWWLPHRPTWIVLNVVAGLALIPAWAWLGFAEAPIRPEPEATPPGESGRGPA